MTTRAPTTDDGHVAAAQMEARVRHLCPLYDHIGMKVHSVGDVIACTVPLTTANSNHLGRMHAAVQWAAAEALGGIAFFAHPELGKGWIAVRDVAIAFIKVARTDLRAEATFDAGQVAAIASQLDSKGTADYQVDIALRDADDHIVTTAVGHYYVRRLTSEKEYR